MRLRIGTRGSALALRQAGMVAADLERRGIAAEIVSIRTSGDVLSGSLAGAGGKGLFVKEIEDALLAGRIECAVHSLKDVPAIVPPGLALVAFPPREDPRDVLVCGAGAQAAQRETASAPATSPRRDRPPGLGTLPRSARVGTSSLRRRAQLLALRPDLAIVELRGNVDTRLRKLAGGEVEAIVLAAAGLARLGLDPPGAAALAPETFVPAIGQGVLALEARDADLEVREALRALDDDATAAAAAAERAFLAGIGGDCRTPLAAYATIASGRLRVRGLVAEIDGSRMLADTREGPVGDAAALGAGLADALLARGAAVIVARARAAEQA